VGIFSKFAKAYRVYDSNAYREAVSSVEKVASASLSSLSSKSEEEKAEILERVTKLGEKLNDAVSLETPLVTALTLLIAIRAHYLSLQEQADYFRAER
jgi:hypothetical protein